MQYILTEEEYKDLTKKAYAPPLVNITRKQLQKLCTDLCNTTPVQEGWYEGKPWECILTVNHEWYCDHCPVQSICPCDRKSYSQ